MTFNPNRIREWLRGYTPVQQRIFFADFADYLESRQHARESFRDLPPADEEKNAEWVADVRKIGLEKELLTIRAGFTGENFNARLKALNDKQDNAFPSEHE